MNLALFGATGFIGDAVLKEALARGHVVRALARDPSRLSPAARLEVVKGDVRDGAAVERVVTGADAVISTLGVRRGVHVAPDYLANAMRMILESMRRHGVSRIVAISGAGITLPGERKPFVVRGRVVEPAVPLHGDVQPQVDGLPGFRRGVEFVNAATRNEARRLRHALETLIERRA